MRLTSAPPPLIMVGQWSRRPLVSSLGKCARPVGCPALLVHPTLLPTMDTTLAREYQPQPIQAVVRRAVFHFKANHHGCCARCSPRVMIAAAAKTWFPPFSSGGRLGGRPTLTAGACFWCECACVAKQQQGTLAPLPVARVAAVFVTRCSRALGRIFRREKDKRIRAIHGCHPFSSRPRAIRHRKHRIWSCCNDLGGNSRST